MGSAVRNGSYAYVAQEMAQLSQQGLGWPSLYAKTGMGVCGGEQTDTEMPGGSTRIAGLLRCRDCFHRPAGAKDTWVPAADLQKSRELEQAVGAKDPIRSDPIRPPPVCENLSLLRLPQRTL